MLTDAELGDLPNQRTVTDAAAVWYLVPQDLGGSKVFTTENKQYAIDTARVQRGVVLAVPVIADFRR